MPNIIPISYMVVVSNLKNLCSTIQLLASLILLLITDDCLSISVPWRGDQCPTEAQS